MASDNIKILYMVSEGRSGSTLLGRILGHIEGCVHVGELDRIWLRFFKQNNLCGCGKSYQECEFWSAVFMQGFGGFDQVNLDMIFAAKQELERLRTVPKLLSPIKTAKQTQILTEYAQVLSTLYRAIRDVSGAGIVVDGSKSPAYAYVLGFVPDVDLRLLHLVRDSRAVAYSNQRKKLNPAVQVEKLGDAAKQETEFLEPVSPFQVAMQWNWTNWLMQIQKPSSRFLFMRYEDIVRDPITAITRLWTLLDELAPDIEFMRESPMYLGPSHTVGGNPDKFNPQVKIRPDTEWREKMSESQRLLVTALTYPLLQQYGYLLENG